MTDDEAEFRRKLGKRIRQLREKKEGLSQTGLAAKLDGKDKQFINRYENEGANPKAYILFKLRHALDTTFDEMFDFTDIKD